MSQTTTDKKKHCNTLPIPIDLLACGELKPGSALRFLVAAYGSVPRRTAFNFYRALVGYDVPIKKVRESFKNAVKYGQKKGSYRAAGGKLIANPSGWGDVNEDALKVLRGFHGSDKKREGQILVPLKVRTTNSYKGQLASIRWRMDHQTADWLWDLGAFDQRSCWWWLKGITKDLDANCKGLLDLIGRMDLPLGCTAYDAAVVILINILKLYSKDQTKNAIKNPVGLLKGRIIKEFGKETVNGVDNITNAPEAWGDWVNDAEKNMPIGPYLAEKWERQQEEEGGE